MNECLSEDDEGEGSATPPKKRLKTKTSKWYAQKFREEWMRDSSFKHWLEAPKHPNTKPLCKVAPFLLDLIKSRCPKSNQETNCLKHMEMGTTKCTNVIRQGIGLHYVKRLRSSWQFV